MHDQIEPTLKKLSGRLSGNFWLLPSLSIAPVLLDLLSPARGVERDRPPELVPWALDAFSDTIRSGWWTGPQQRAVVLACRRMAATERRAWAEADIDLPFPTRTALSQGQAENTDGDTARWREGRSSTRREPRLGQRQGTPGHSIGPWGQGQRTLAGNVRA